ncbi:ATP-dependent DNA helicase RecG [Methylotenera sp.]|uniref:ATP-dependent DNA helicase RecG n=1 Tax=Methylotenera sp. TaxID=2051956 RepID=UPI002723E73D|nr:ATP-dependent DNA helicase RecG [Methylotenera sp.]MDO9205274.1 ATP-dependent DNA helicase RecG [Methylotenera sp.]MDP2072378.1 ATP-dependent DNA helicase RecG [Methylotenera sp.]MDP3005621.1 ATP-dependent DNA helicase RecG [Methylotenera sp.]MDP3307582.1 ATP-dependent DNA helicase RecG [Methylotenera sp.]MDP3817832.1 ATP-dependent DNA helicase RecG [Methylotenera sp.]
MTNLSEIKAFSKPLIANLNKLGINTVQALLLHLPLRYIDETHVTSVRDLRLGEPSQVEGEIVHAEVTYKPRKALIARLEDTSGQLTLRFLHFYPSQIATLKVGAKLRVYGEVRSGFFGYEMVHPTCKTVGEKTTVAETLTPVYPTVAGLTQASLRKAIAIALAQNVLNETLPAYAYQQAQLENFSFPSFSQSLKSLHNPPPDADLQGLENKTTPEWQRLAFDELLAQQLSMRKHYARRRSVNAPQFKPSKQLVSALLKSLPFALTQAQQKVALEIERDLTQLHPMQRLLQGDVGSGKTIVACMAALQSIESGWQVALMAPTEILAEQHFRKMQSWLTPLKIQIAWLTGSQSKKDRDTAMQSIADGSAQLVIGTHALFQEAVQFKKLGLAIIDEQHRFGVQQRLALRQKGQPEPHQLMMTATPIPRTLSMSYYADLDVSVIDELPPGRTPIVTKLVSDGRRDEILQRVREACMQGNQAYWVCPLIEESEALQLATANDTYALMQNEFPELQVGLVHGRMKPAEKQAVMAAFSAGDLQLLVATTVIEVGVDVPNASLMVIEHAERMGLSQLHQLRGRVGRGAAKSTCILLYQNKLSETARARLKVIYESNDGFAIAQADLNLRGPGEFLGVRQSGVPMLKIADLNRDGDLLIVAKTLAEKLLKEYPAEVEEHLDRWMGSAGELVKV